MVMITFMYFYSKASFSIFLRVKYFKSDFLYKLEELCIDNTASP